MVSLLRSHLASPSRKSGFVPSASDKRFPNLWPDYGWVPELGITGSTLRDIGRHKAHATFNSTIEPSWEIDGQMGQVLEWATADANPYLNAGNIELDFTASRPWSILVFFLVSNTALDDRTMFSKWTGAGADSNQIRIRTNKETAPADLEIEVNDAPEKALLNIVELNKWYCAVVTNDGTAAANGINCQIREAFAGKIIDQAVSQHNGDAVLTSDVLLFGRPGTADEMLGKGGPTYLYNHVLLENELFQIAADVPVAGLIRMRWVAARLPSCTAARE